MEQKIEMPDFLAIAEQLKSDMRRYAKVYCLQWFDDSFQNQGFTDESFQPWPKRKAPDRRAGAAILQDTTFLRKSIDVLREDESTVAFGTHVPYAAVHNYGLRVRATQNVRAHHRVHHITQKRYQVQPHTRQIDIQYPQRQFIGESAQMMRNLDQWLIRRISKTFNQEKQD